MGDVTVPSAGPVITEADIDAVVAVLRSGVLANGPEVVALEDAFAAYCGVAHAVAVSSGTDALTLAGQALGLVAGDTVLVSGFTFAASANAFLALGCRVVPVDVDPTTFNIDGAALERALAEHADARALVVVDLFGSTTGTDAAIDRARAAGLLVIEDAAQAHGALVADGTRVGSRGDATTFSLYATKNMVAGEGGLITTTREDVAARIRLLRSHGAQNQYEHEVLGLNHRLPEMSAALARSQLTRLEDGNAVRRRQAGHLAEWCRAAFDDHVLVPAEAGAVVPGPHVFHQFTVRCIDGATRDRLVEGLQAKGIGARVFYPYVLADLPGVEAASTPVARSLTATVCSLPVQPGLSESQLDQLRLAIESVGLDLRTG